MSRGGGEFFSFLQCGALHYGGRMGVEKRWRHTVLLVALIILLLRGLDGGADVDVALREGNFDAVLVEDSIDILLDKGDVGDL